MTFGFGLDLVYDQDLGRIKGGLGQRRVLGMYAGTRSMTDDDVLCTGWASYAAL